MNMDGVGQEDLETVCGEPVYPVLLPKRELDKRKAKAAADKELRRVANLHFDATSTEECLERGKYRNCRPCERCGLGIGEIMNCDWCEHECHLRATEGRDAALRWRGIGKKARDLLADNQVSEARISRAVHLAMALDSSELDLINQSQKYQVIKAFVDKLVLEQIDENVQNYQERMARDPDAVVAIVEEPDIEAGRKETESCTSIAADGLTESLVSRGVLPKEPSISAEVCAKAFSNTQTQLRGKEGR